MIIIERTFNFSLGFKFSNYLQFSKNKNISLIQCVYEVCYINSIPLFINTKNNSLNTQLKVTVYTQIHVHYLTLILLLSLQV